MSLAIYLLAPRYCKGGVYSGTNLVDCSYRTVAFLFFSSDTKVVSRPSSSDTRMGITYPDCVELSAAFLYPRRGKNSKKTSHLCERGQKSRPS